MIFYVTNNIERAVGIDLEMYPEVHFVSNSSPLADLLAQHYPGRVILESGEYLSTLELIKKYVGEMQKKTDKVKILVFKNTPQIERYCSEQGWQLLNASAELVNKFERKLSQHDWLDSVKLNIKRPKTEIKELEGFAYDQLTEDFGQSSVMQYDTGHTGQGTIQLDDEEQLAGLQSKFPKRPVKISEYIPGSIYTINACVRGKEVLCGEISLQLTGLPGLTDNPLATVGNDWGAVQQSLKSEQVSAIKLAAEQIGQAMAAESWQGLFGFDVVVKEGANEVYLIEINARQPASSSFEAQLAHLQNCAGPLDWQLRALAGLSSKLQITRPQRQGAALVGAANYNLKAAQIFLRKAEGPTWQQFKNISRVGEYDNELNLLEEKPIFDLDIDSKNLFITHNTHEARSELLRVQANTAENLKTAGLT